MVQRRESLRGHKAQESNGFTLDETFKGLETRLFSWEEVAEAPGGGRKVFTESARAEREKETSFGSRERSKALKGEAQECWTLKKGFKGGKSL